MRRGVYICCAPGDNAVALALSRALERRSINTWIAFRDVPPGEVYQSAAVEAIARSYALVLVVSSKTANSLQAAREFQFASESGLPVIAFRVEDASGGDLITKLGSRQRFDAFPPPVEDHLDAFVTQLSDLIRNAEAGGSPLAGDTRGQLSAVDDVAGTRPPSRTEANQRTHTDRDVQRRVDEPASREEPPTAVRGLDEATMAQLADRNATLRRSPATPAEEVGARADARDANPASFAPRLSLDHDAAPGSPPPSPRAGPVRRNSRSAALPFVIATLVVGGAVALLLRHELAGVELWLAKFLRLGAPAPAPAFGGDVSEVDVSVFAPTRARREAPFLVQALAHLSTESVKSVGRLANEVDPDSRRRGVATLDVEIAPGERLDFVLESEGLAIAEPQQSFIWRGRSRGCAFLVRAPRDFPNAAANLKLRVLRNATPVGSIRFAVAIDEAVTIAAMELAGNAAARHRRVFLSYASSDRVEVLKRAQGLRAAGLDFFQDLLSLEPGERWERRLYAEIERSDLFLLFWSRAARDSEWVMREVAHAKSSARAGGRPAEILPVILEGPPPPPPPELLKDLHFDDPLCYLIAAVEKMNAARPAS
jgi:hypothetical protein